MSALLRLCEGGRLVHRLDDWQRAQIEWAARSWQQAGRLRRPPLQFEGAHSQILCAAPNLVGVVACGDVTVEIYPKLDSALLEPQASPDDFQARTVWQSLLWMMEVGMYGAWIPTGAAALQEEPESFFDLWAFLLGHALLGELTNGISRHYRHHADDLTAVRGRIAIAEQVSRNWNRMDKIACEWDEFTPDTPFNRLLKCCLRFLLLRTYQPRARQLVERCLIFFDDVQDTGVADALWQTRHMRWDRSTERFRNAFQLARRLLENGGHGLNAGSADSFVFLIDMAKVFEQYVAALLEARFQTAIETQKPLGRLFDLPSGGILQIADYFWQCGNTIFIGDAKYKHLTKGHNGPLTFEEMEEETARPLAGRVLGAADVRQLTVYAELAKKKFPINEVSLLLLYPYVGAAPLCSTATAWNGAQFSLVPVAMHRRESLAGCLPEMRVGSMEVTR